MPRRRKASSWSNRRFLLLLLVALSGLAGVGLVFPSLSVDYDNGTRSNLEDFPTEQKVPLLLQNTNSSSSSSRHPNFMVNFPLCLVHVGKAAGSSVSCGLGLIYANCEGMPRDKLPRVHFFHMRRNNCPPNTQTYVVTLRNPVTRIQSWFEFEKDIVPTRKNKQEEQQLKRKRGMLFEECYSNFTDLVLRGLKPLKNPVRNAKPVNMTCPERAWAAVLGARAFSYHEWYNYEHYWNGIKGPARFPRNNNNHQSSSLQVLRTEHLLEDWSTISTEPLFRPVNRGKSSSSSIAAGGGGNDLLSNLNKEAVDHLCHAMCPEIQIYKQILEVAENINTSQKQMSMNELRTFCPLEKNLEARECPGIPSFPSLKVPLRQYQTETKKRFYEIMPPT